MKRKSTLLLVLLLVVYNYSNGQNGFEHNFNNSDEFNTQVDFNDLNSTKKIKLILDEPASVLEFKFLGTIKAGGLNVAIYDPLGKKEGGFELLAESGRYSNTDGATVNGDMHKQVQNPLQGIWIIVLNADETTGVIKISSTAHF